MLFGLSAILQSDSLQIRYSLGLLNFNDHPILWFLRFCALSAVILSNPALTIRMEYKHWTIRENEEDVVHETQIGSGVYGESL